MKYLPEYVDYNLETALEAYTKIFFLLTPEQQKKHKDAIDKYYLCNELGALNFDELLTKSEAVGLELVCPFCKGTNVLKNGKVNTNRQRYICSSCKKTFYAAHNTLLSNVTQDVSVWVKFIRGMLKQQSLEDLSDECGINKSTALNWRLRVFQALEILCDKVKLSGIIIADDTRIKYNLKGNHGEDFIMPRNSRARGGSYSTANSNENTLCILCAIDENGNSFSKIVGFGNPSAARIHSGFKDKIDLSNENNILVTDGAQYFKKTYEKYGFANWHRQVTLTYGSKKVPNTNSNYNIQPINAYHSRLKRFIRNFNGVSSKYLPGYLLLFDYLQNNKNIDETILCKEILSTMVIAPRFSNEQIEMRYMIPTLNRIDAELWERRISVIEQKIYQDWVKKVPIKEITTKYQIPRRKIYVIKDKVEKHNLHAVIINKKIKRYTKPPSRTSGAYSMQDWEIFLKYYNQGISARRLATEYSVGRGTIYCIVNAIKNRPEAQKIEKHPDIGNRNILQKSQEIINRNKIIYDEYKVLNSSGLFQKDIFEILAKKYNRSIKYIGNLIYEYKSNDITSDYRYHWTEERKNLDPDEYYEFLQKRNRAFVKDVDEYTASNPKASRNKAFKALAGKYNISDSYASLVYYHPQKYLYIYDEYLEKQKVKQPEEVREQAP